MILEPEESPTWKKVVQPHVCEPPDSTRHPVWRGIVGGTVRHMNELWTCPGCEDVWWCEPCDDGVLRWRRVGLIREWWIRRRKARA